MTFGTQTPKPPQYTKVDTRSHYLKMRDGVRIAIDVNLPVGVPDGQNLPTLMILTRYWRSFALRVPAPPAKVPMGPRAVGVGDFWVGQGYALVTVDARGSGASFGTWRAPFSSEELDDYCEVVEWITQQTWSNGKVGAFGISYEGSTAQLLAALGHPAVKAVIPQQYEFDLYSDVALPGGVFNEAFIRHWNHWNNQLDQNRSSVFGFFAGLMVKGVRPIDEDTKGTLLKSALTERTANPDVFSSIQNITYRDDLFGKENFTLDDLSVFSRQRAIEQSNTALFTWGSWFDGATADTVLRGFMNFDNPMRAVIGTWSHDLETDGSPYHPPKKSPIPPKSQQWAEMNRFFEQHLKNEHEPLEKVLHYYTIGEDKWKQTSVFPPQGTTAQIWYLSKGHELVSTKPASTGVDSYVVDYEATTGTDNRWHTEKAQPVIYRDRTQSDKRLLTYTSAPLEHDIEVTGYPVVTLYVTSTADDGAFYVYLEDVDPSDKVFYISEGLLRAIHRKVSPQPPHWIGGPYHTFKREDGMPLLPGEVVELTFNLFPTSVLFRKRHRIRVAIAGHDKDSFARIPAQGIPTITVQHGSFIELPVIQR
jgi:putative CocE/NonD family hydrolase